jgi:hypothetical protein
MSNKKKLIRERMAKTGESYQAAQRHVVGGGRFEAIVNRVATLARAAGIEYDEASARLPIARTLYEGPDPSRNSVKYSALLVALRALSPADTRKMRMLMYSGRDNEPVSELSERLHIEDPRVDVAVMMGKFRTLSRNLRNGLVLAAKEGFDLEAPLSDDDFDVSRLKDTVLACAACRHLAEDHLDGIVAPGEPSCDCKRFVLAE